MSDETTLGGPESAGKYDSTPDTLAHIAEVQALLWAFADALDLRATKHDQSKLSDPEKEAFDVATPKLKAMTYGSDEYKQALADLGPALQHHYEANSHHPEHNPNGINGMGMIDLVEMFCDWIAATKRHADGDIHRSIELNQKRFGYDDGIRMLLANSVGTFE